MGGEGPIPFGAIDRFATRAGYENDAFWRFKTLIRAMDGAYLEHRSVVRERMRKQALSQNDNRDLGAERVATARKTMARKKAAGED